MRVSCGRRWGSYLALVAASLVTLVTEPTLSRYHELVKEVGWEHLNMSSMDAYITMTAASCYLPSVCCELWDAIQLRRRCTHGTYCRAKACA